MNDGYTIFCDDLRVEVGSKLTLVGVYGAELVVHTEFPVTLPKFALYINYIEAFEERSDPVTLRVYLPGDDDDHPSFTGDIPVSEMRTALAAPTSEETQRAAAIHLVVAPLVVKAEGSIKVRALTGRGIVKLGSLRVRQKLATAQNKAPSTD